jgi:putative membrane protein
MNRLIIRWAINAVALYVAVVPGWLPGIHFQSTKWWAIPIMAIIFGLVNALVRPLLKFLTCPLILLTLGLFTLFINAGLFWLTGLIGNYFNIGFTVEGFWPAMLGGLVVGVITALLTLLVKDELHPRRGK